MGSTCAWAVFPAHTSKTASIHPVHLPGMDVFSTIPRSAARQKRSVPAGSEALLRPEFNQPMPGAEEMIQHGVSCGVLEPPAMRGNLLIELGL